MEEKLALHFVINPLATDNCTDSDHTVRQPITVSSRLYRNSKSWKNPSVLHA